MASGMDYAQEYGQAEKAYLQGNFQESAKIIDRMAEEFPDDPTVLLLRGHIYCYGLHKYELALQQYESVLQLTDRSDLIDYANKGLEQIRQFQSRAEADAQDLPEATQLEVGDREFGQAGELAGDLDSQNWVEGESKFGIEEEFSDSSWENGFQVDSMDLDSTKGGENYLEEPSLPTEQPFANPFASETQNNFEPTFEELSHSDRSANPFDHGAVEKTELDDGENLENQSSNFPFPEEEKAEYGVNNFSESENSTFVVSSEPEATLLMNSDKINNLGSDRFEEEQAVQAAEDEPGDRPQESQDFSEDFDVFNDEDLEEITKFDAADVESPQSDVDLLNPQSEGESENLDLETANNPGTIGDEKEASLSDTTDSAAANLTSLSLEEPTVEVKQGLLARFENASLSQKQWIAAGAAGVASAIAVFLASLAVPKIAADNSQGVRISPLSPNSVLISLIAGAASFGTILFLGQITTNQVKRSTEDLQAQFKAVHQGNFNAKATVYSKDEFGQLAAGFNQMARVILTTTSETQRRAEEMEQAKEDMTRQVIRLLDDVEGAARGDLTVKATVTADVLGAVADAFNLTIQNLQEIIRQVKQAAVQVNKGSTESEVFARNQSSDALRMAEELAVTLNSVQMMTDSIQRVAESAREAEEVARSSSVTALKGGEAVERTVAGILEIRETVSDTTRKVKRLAEASQEISKIVALISQIASRTNLLALNASIEAARAGEAGRGFAIVADEVRQLADRSAKSLKEIEQIVLQIQSETGSVMTAMEEGIQEVIDVTERAEQAKRALEDIIQVSNHIDGLVRSITADTVEQRENSRAVAQVMQSVELTAQETSQESQRVAGSLQNLVGISQDLLTSVERFRVEADEQ